VEDIKTRTKTSRDERTAAESEDDYALV